VPSAANYGFFVVWFVLVSLTIAWWRQHPWRSFLVPIVSVPRRLGPVDDRLRVPGMAAMTRVASRRQAPASARDARGEV